MSAFDKYVGQKYVARRTFKLDPKTLVKAGEEVDVSKWAPTAIGAHVNLGIIQPIYVKGKGGVAPAPLAAPQGEPAEVPPESPSEEPGSDYVAQAEEPKSSKKGKGKRKSEASA